MTAPVFVDTNVIVHRFDTRDPRKQSRAVDWFTFLWNRHSGRVSFGTGGTHAERGRAAVRYGNLARAGVRRCPLTRIRCSTIVWAVKNVTVTPPEDVTSWLRLWAVENGHGISK